MAKKQNGNGLLSKDEFIAALKSGDFQKAGVESFRDEIEKELKIFYEKDSLKQRRLSTHLRNNEEIENPNIRSSDFKAFLKSEVAFGSFRNTV